MEESRKEDKGRKNEEGKVWAEVNCQCVEGA
jgi:hypothetical protein